MEERHKMQWLRRHQEDIQIDTIYCCFQKDSLPRLPMEAACQAPTTLMYCLTHAQIFCKVVPSALECLLPLSGRAERQDGAFANHSPSLHLRT